jgi:hypothetical protein
MTGLLFPVFSRITKNGLSPAYSKDAKHLPDSKIYDMGEEKNKESYRFQVTSSKLIKTPSLP